MKRINNKGFTLIELLSIIVILGLITSITITTVLTMLSKSKDKSIELTKRNIRAQAEKYVYEGFSEDNWKKDNSITGKTTEYKCVTVQDLIDVGYYKQSIIEENSDLLSATDVVKITRDSETKAIISKEIMSNSPDCEIDSGMSIIECRYDQGYAMEKDVQILFHNSTDYEKRVDLKNISLYAIPSNGGLPLEQVNGYYIANGNEAHVTAKANGVIFAYTVDYGKQIASLYCNVVGIDRTPPKVKLEVIDNNDLKCTITDKESGVESYKLCILGDSDCSPYVSNGYESFVSNPITREDVENGYWECSGKDKAGNIASASVFINNSPEATAAAEFIAEELKNDDTVYGPHNGDTWTNKNVRLTGTITANVDTWYKITDSSNTPSDSEWEKYEISNELTTFKAILTITGTTNKPYYLHVKAGKMDEIIHSLNVKVDKTPPTCSLSIPTNNNASGITVTTTCSDSHSGCTSESSGTYTNVINNTTYTVYDKVGNKKNCSVTVTQIGYRKYCNESYGDPNTIGVDIGTYRVGCHVVLNKNNYDNMEICGEQSNSTNEFCIKKSTSPSLSKLKNKLEDLPKPEGRPRTSTYYIDIKENIVRQDHIKKEKGLDYCIQHKGTSFAKNGFWKKVSEISSIDYNKNRSKNIPYLNDANNSSKATLSFHTYSCRYKDVVSTDSCTDNPGFKYDASMDIGYTCVKVYHGTV